MLTAALVDPSLSHEGYRGCIMSRKKGTKYALDLWNGDIYFKKPFIARFFI